MSGQTKTIADCDTEWLTPRARLVTRSPPLSAVTSPTTPVASAYTRRGS